MGEFRVHQVRFFDYMPQAINCLAYEEKLHKLAVSRSDGSIEILSIDDNWYQEKILYPSNDASIEALVWCQQRLFSGGLHGNVHEHDILKGTIKATSSSNSGAIWCLARNHDQTKIAAGTEDGCIVLFDILDDDVVYNGALNKQEGRILSIAWHTGLNYFVTGGVDNIRIWSANSGHAIQRITVARQERNKETIVWAIAVTEDFTIISGDSQGKTCFWNGQHGTLVKSFQSHKADVLAIAVSKDGHAVYSSGIDPSLAQFAYIAPERNSDWKQWVRSTVHLQHSHDVRAIAITDDSVVSGGVDCHIILNRIDVHPGKKGRPWRRISPVPQSPLVYTAALAQVVMLRYPDSLELWKLGSTRRTSDASGEVLPLSSNPVKLLQLKCKCDETIVCAALSPDASWLAYCDTEKLRLFSLTIEEKGLASPVVTMNRVRYSPPGTLSSRCLSFTPDGSMLVSGTTNGTVQLLSTDVAQPKLLHTWMPPGDTRPGIHLLTVSPNGKYVATGDHDHNINIYSIPKQQYICSLPSYHRQPTSVAFHHTLPLIITTYSDQQIYEYNYKQREYTEWSRQLGRTCPSQWLNRPNKLFGITYNPHNPDQILLHDEQVFCIIDKTQPLPSRKEALFSSPVFRQKSDDKQHTNNHCFHICSKYKFLLHASFLDDDFLLIVEQPQMTILKALPPSMKQKKFGT